MAFGNTPKDVTLIPLGSVAVPGHSGGDLTALRGANASTDGNGNETADVSTAVPDGANITQGLLADAAWSGSGSGSVVSVLKKIVAGQTGTASVIPGNTASTPFPTEPNIATWIRGGQAFIARQLGNATSANGHALGLFNPSSSGKSALVYRILLMAALAGQSVQLYTQTTNPAFGTITQAAVNKALGNATSSVVTLSGATSAATQPVSTLLYSTTMIVNTTPIDLLRSGEPILLPAGSAQALAVWLGTGGTLAGNIHIEWVEF